MRRIFFGVVGIGAGLAAIHFAGRFLQVRESSGCYGDPRCMQMVQRGGETRSDRQYAIGLFVLAGVCIWMAAGKDP